MIIGIDFDGTCVTHRFPELGRDIGAQRVLNKLVEKGHQLILYTMRSNMLTPITDQLGDITPDKKGDFLNQAIRWFNDNDIPLYGVNTNPDQKIWTESPKAYCQLYIDDASLGIPLVYEEGERPYVDWVEVEDILYQQGIL